jgi:hypothetical protein
MELLGSGRTSVMESVEEAIGLLSLDFGGLGMVCAWVLFDGLERKGTVDPRGSDQINILA